jgi:L-cysteine/cystine lyase
VSLALAGLPLEPGDELLTSDSEHPGVLGPLQAARDLRGAAIRVVPLADLADAVGPRTRAVVCSHVSWVSGEVAPVQELAAADASVILDGAQGIGAVPLDVGKLGCDVYAGSGQKWLCGPEGTGMLYVAPAFRERLASTRRGWGAFADAGAGLESELQPDARRYEPPSNQGAALLAHALAAHDVLAAAGWDAVHERARRLAASLARRLTEAGRDVLARDYTTLVAWRDDDPPASAQRLGGEGVAIRYLPGRGLLRASVGAWNDEDDLERLVSG